MIQYRNATINDVDAIFKLTNKNASEGMMLPRSKYKIINMLFNFYVAIDSESKEVVGCAALSPLWTDMAEVMALAVSDSHQRMGIGKKMVEDLLVRAKELGFPKVISLTYQVEFFKQLGFQVTDKDQFPRKLWRECLECPKLEHCDEIAMYIDIQ